MDKQITLVRNNENKDWTDLEWIQEFHSFLTGTTPNAIRETKSTLFDLSPEKAFTIIWYLQERFSILPDNIEMCCECKELFDTHKEGYYSENEGSHFCECSEDRAYYKDNPIED